MIRVMEERKDLNEIVKGTLAVVTGFVFFGLIGLCLLALLATILFV